MEIFAFVMVIYLLIRTSTFDSTIDTLTEEIDTLEDRVDELKKELDALRAA